MAGLTELCALPKASPRSPGKYKQPRLSEAADLLCNGPGALSPTESLRRIEEKVGSGFPHVSLADCFELYRVVTRVLLHHSDRLRFTSLSVPFRPPRAPQGDLSLVRPRSDSFVESLRAFEARLQAVTSK